MTILQFPTLPTRLFTYKAGTFLTEASDLKGYAGAAPHRIYDDACDVGIALESPDGNVVRYYLDDESTCPSNEDVTAWTFKPIAEDVRRFPRVAGTSVVILND